jgi:hypothetical protein
MNATADNRSCRSQARWIGVWPDGAHVRRRAGWSMKPLSSKKTRGLPLRAAPFLSAASLSCASESRPHRPPRAPVAPASGKSTPSRGVFAPHNPGDTPRGIAGRQLRQYVNKSKNRCDTRPSVVQPKEFPRVDVSAPCSSGALVQDAVLLSRRPCLLSPQPDATDSPKTAKRQEFPQPRRLLCRPGAIVHPAADELPIPLRFLSVSYLYIRIFTINGSLNI